MNEENSREGAKTRKNVEELSAIVVDCAYKLHVEAGPGLLESVYEVVLAKMLEERGLHVKRQVPVPIQLMGLKFDEGFRADLIVDGLLLVELKSVENFAPVHAKQVLTYLDVETAKLDALVRKVEEAVERLQEYRTALITAAVTGKIDVRKCSHPLR